MSAPTAPPEPAPAPGAARFVSEPAARPLRSSPWTSERGPTWAGAAAIAGVILWLTFYAKGGLKLESMVTTEIALTLGGALVVALAAWRGAFARPLHGGWAVASMLAFTLLTALSIVWSVQPDDSLIDAGRMFAYSAVFAAAVALARMAPGQWRAVLGGLTLAATVVCGYALLTKIFPHSLARSEIYARLEAPFGYWNATGLAAAMGAIGCLWLGARRSGHALLSALAYPAMGILLLTLVLAYSRGALVALAIGLLAWFVLVPLRLRGAAVLILGAVGAVAVTAWDFSTHALSTDAVPLSERVGAGHQLGVAVAAMVVLLALAGVAIGFATDRRSPSIATRRQAGTALIALIVVALIAFAAALAHSQRGFTGSISHAAHALTDPNSKPPPNTSGRLTAVASVRARYWKEALEVFEAHPVLGAGAEGYATARLRYRTVPLQVRHAHGFVVQTLADLGLAGLVCVLALLLFWMAAAGRATHPLNRRWATWREMREGTRPGWRRIGAREPREYTPERIGLLSMLCLVVVFGAHSLVDWTWYVPGDACVALLCAGWLAGRGPLARPGANPVSDGRGGAGSEPVTVSFASVPARERSRAAFGPGPRRLGRVIAVAVLAGAILVVFVQAEPQRSADARQEAQTLLETNPAAAPVAARRAISRDPLSAEALFVLSSVQGVRGEEAASRDSLRRAVQLQPSNPQTWLELGRHDLTSDPRAALAELRAAIYLDPQSISPELVARADPPAVTEYNDYIQALRSVAQLKSESAQRKRAAAAAKKASRRKHARGSARSQSPPAAG